MRSYTADFETTTDPEDCRVWAVATCDIENPDDIWISNDVYDFVDWMSDHTGSRVYFHNLSFDSIFLISALELAGWEYVEDIDTRTRNTYSAMVSDMNQVYSLTLWFSKRKKVVLYDSYRVIPLKVADVAKAFDLPMGKGDLDYEAFRERGHEITPEERDYIERDVKIMALAMGTMLAQGMDKMTAGANALADFKAGFGGHKGFRSIFPLLTDDEDEFIRRAYRGGYVYCDPRTAGELVGDGIVLDVNSLYPSVMWCAHGELMPFGRGEWFDGCPMEYERIDRRPLWVACVVCSFELREDRLPCIQLKGNNRFKATEYLASSDGEVCMTLTSVDYALYTEHYEFEVYEWMGGYCFQGSTDYFRDYIAKWTQVKVEAGRVGNKGMRQLAKLMLNSLYGKLATRPVVKSRKPVIEDGIVRFRDLPDEHREGVYLPAGVFITSWARWYTVTSCQANYERFCYADTDSMHLLGTELPEGIEIDDQELGKWAHEATFSRARFLRAKCYAEEVDGELEVHVSGMPDRCHEYVTLENFEIGMSYPGKLYRRNVPGGIVLEEGPMTLRAH